MAKASSSFPRPVLHPTHLPQYHNLPHACRDLHKSHRPHRLHVSPFSHQHHSQAAVNCWPFVLSSSQCRADPAHADRTYIRWEITARRNLEGQTHRLPTLDVRTHTEDPADRRLLQIELTTHIPLEVVDPADLTSHSLV